MQPEKSSIARLFDQQCIYIVPKYQRQYVWRMEDQWEPLWLDVIDIADVLFEDACKADKTEVNPSSVESHYLGAVVLKIGGTTPSEASKWKVIDGQQRLTTIQLLIAATYKNFKERDFQQAKRLENLIVNSTAEAKSERLKLQHRETSYEQFSKVLESVTENSQSVSAGGPMVECFDYFYEVVRKWLNERNSNLQLAAKSLLNAMVSKLHLVAIYLDVNEKEHQIFETLNDRGEPLTEWDKIKNYLLHKGDVIAVLDQDKLYDHYLTKFDDEWWRALEGRGFQQRPRTDIFTNYWLESRNFSFVGAKRVFKEFKKYIDKKEDNIIENEIQQFFQDAEYYRKYLNVDFGDSDFERQFHNRRQILSIGAVWPLLLYLHRRDFSQEAREQYFAHFDSYFLRRKICSYQARGYGQMSLDILRELESMEVSDDDVADSICKILLGYTGTARIWPGDEDTKRAILEYHHALYTNKILLRAIEGRLTPSNSGGYFVKEDIHVEHLMPRGWNEENWPMSDNSNDAIEKRNSLVHTLGNLTFLNGPLNIKLQNSSWNVKRKEIEESDNLFINQQLIKNFYSKWDEDAIKARGESYATMITEIWPQ